MQRLERSYKWNCGIEIYINQGEIDILYASLKKHNYIIHSILIHEGAADTGHYYAYIYKHT